VSQQNNGTSLIVSPAPPSYRASEANLHGSCVLEIYSLSASLGSATR
jgi:hypothetical protein